MSPLNIGLFFVTLFVDLTDFRELSEQDKLNLHHAFTEENYKWPSGNINFRLDNKIDDLELNILLDAMYEIENNTCIRFIPVDESSELRYVLISKSDFGGLCYSDIGYQKDSSFMFEQRVMLSKYCFIKGIVVHELMHLIGFLHHQSRSDRDKYIKVHFENLDLLGRSQFTQKINSDDKIEFKSPFDFDSIMLYSNETFSKNGKPTITLNKVNFNKELLSVESKSKLSINDINLVKFFYNCTGDYKESKIFYDDKNGKLINPKKVNYDAIEKAKSDHSHFYNSVIRLILTAIPSIFCDWLSSFQNH